MVKNRHHGYNTFISIHVVSEDERAVASSDYDSTYDSTFETNHSDSSDFAQNDEEGEGGGKKPPEVRDGPGPYRNEGISLHPLVPDSPEVGLNTHTHTTHTNTQIKASVHGEVYQLSMDASLGREKTNSSQYDFLG